MLHLLLWVSWSFLLITLSYKQKVIGEEGVRPWYIPGIVYGFSLLAWLAAKYPRLLNFRWQNGLELCISCLLYALIGYVVFQSVFYPDSIRPMLYASATVSLIFTLALFSINLVGWNTFTLAITRILLLYGLINIIIILAGNIWPESISHVLVPADKSGFGIRIYGLAGDPTHLGCFLGLAILLWYIKRRDLSTFWFLVAIALFFALNATGSRNAMLSLIFAGVISTLTGLRWSLVRLIKFLLLLVSAGLLAHWILFKSSLGSNYLLDVYRFTDENAFSRLDIWRDIFELAKKLSYNQIFFGGGFLFITEMYGSPYNAFVKTFFNQGIFFLITLSLILILIIFLISKNRDINQKKICTAILVYWLCFSMFLDTVFAEFFHIAEFCFWLAAALAVNLRNQASAGRLIKKRYE